MKLEKDLAIELYGGPHDGFAIDCPLTPPPYFILPECAGAHEMATVYCFDRVSCAGGLGCLRYVFCGYQPMGVTDWQALRAGGEAIVGF